MITSRELRDQAGKLVDRMREINDRADAEGRDFTAEEQTNWDAAKSEWKSLLARIERAEYLESAPAQDEEQRVWHLQQDRMSAPKDEADAQAREKRAYEQAFRDYITAQNPRMLGQETWSALYKGMQPIDDAEKQALGRYRNAMSVGSQSGGGFWVPDAMMQRIEKALLWFGGMRQFGEVISTDDGADLPWPVYDDTANSGRRLSENTAATQTDLSVGVRVLKAHMYSSDEVLVSFQLLQDRPDLAGDILADALGERVARAQNTDFTSNGAPDGPQGLIRATTSALTAASATEVTADELHRLQYAVNRAYRDHPSSVYMMADDTLGEVLRIKDGVGNYIFVQPNNGGEPMVWGKRVVVNNDMPATATGNIAVVFGKGHAYKIREVRGFTLLRMDERYAPSLQVSFLGFARADGGYINAGQNPIQHIVMA